MNSMDQPTPLFDALANAVSLKTADHIVTMLSAFDANDSEYVGVFMAVLAGATTGVLRVLQGGVDAGAVADGDATVRLLTTSMADIWRQMQAEPQLGSTMIQ